MQFYCDHNRHLICIPYSIENLHLMAEELNIKKCWFHSGDKAHYDIPKRRITEIQSKCFIVTSEDIVNIIRGRFILQA